MSMIGIDAEETAQALDDHAEFAAAELMRDLDSRLTQAQAENTRLRQVIAHLMTNPLDTHAHVCWTSDIDGQTGHVDITDAPDAGGDGRTIIRITEQ